MGNALRKVGRNQICPCGSGFKYKKCCLTKQLAPTEQSIQHGYERLRKKTQEVTEHEVTFVTDHPGTKLSEVILDLAKEFLDKADSLEEMEVFVMFACTAWNLAVLVQPDEFDDEIDRFINMMEIKDTKAIQDARRIVKILFHKKLQDYPDIKRTIINFDFSGNNKDFHLSIASSMQNSPESIP